MHGNDVAETGGGQGGTAEASADPERAPDWPDWLLEAMQGPPKTRQQRGLPPTPEEIGRAALWCAQDRVTDAEIARQLGIGRRTLARWKQRPEFRAALVALQERQGAG